MDKLYLKDADVGAYLKSVGSFIDGRLTDLHRTADHWNREASILKALYEDRSKQLSKAHAELRVAQERIIALEKRNAVLQAALDADTDNTDHAEERRSRAPSPESVRAPDVLEEPPAVDAFSILAYAAQPIHRPDTEDVVVNVPIEEEASPVAPVVKDEDTVPTPVEEEKASRAAPVVKDEDTAPTPVEEEASPVAPVVKDEDTVPTPVEEEASPVAPVVKEEEAAPTEKEESEVEEELEVYEQKIGGKTYYVSSKEDRTIYECLPGGEVGEPMGRIEKINGKSKAVWF